MDTIHAESTPPGRGGISVVRLSGPEARRIAEDLAGPLPQARHSYLRRIVSDGQLIDHGLVVRFDARASFTGEDVVEFHLHGAPIISRLLQEAVAARGARHALPGEFTQRGFLNGQLGLSEAEALSDLLAAETESQHRQAIRVADGALQEWAVQLRGKLVRAGALIAASIDFADEDVPEDVPAEVFTLLDEVRDSIKAQLDGFPAAERLRDGFEVALIGPPNAGKSSLLNAIARREVALVTPVAGTTRDVLEVRIDLRGLAVTFLDTAGLRETADHVERLGIDRANQRAASADLRVHLSEDGRAVKELLQSGDVVITSKSDLREGDVSAITGEGVVALLDRIHDILRARAAAADMVTRQRQADALRRASAGLQVSPSDPPEIVAESLNIAVNGLREVVGETGVEDYLDEVFSAFCIGK
ncbi:tRNA uridine-5-carboxymethylaminomethyl(34) synthesis GTPase MnmE [Paracoccus sp. Z118]|uniref:tRNA uridine-5-carboxymethylaminomethyl(34) synthesis GTPase MnmE n=1 Tax=Paracoccus sp. Z118 TaxID=2851017 RepID=UPI001C2BB2F7|nr:tRNA uridine-5-carboxymethylaminomethyl(34) synthesis GTPase MnmE [Paracoccus sp. Z118]